MMYARSKILIPLILGLLLQIWARAEYRPWSGKTGSSVEAEYVRTDGDLVVLRLRSGSEVKVVLDALCDEDRRYAMLQSPPKIDITVSDKVERSNVGYTGGNRNGSQVRNETVTTSVELKKSGSVLYDLPLAMEVILVGRIEALDRYVILDRSTSNFSFTEENKGIIRIQCKPVDVRQTSGSRQSGAGYSGYLVVIRDAAKNIVGIKTSRLDFSKNSDVLLAAGKGAVLDREFKLIRDGKPERKTNSSQ